MLTNDPSWIAVQLPKINITGFEERKEFGLV